MHDHPVVKADQFRLALRTIGGVWRGGHCPPHPPEKLVSLFLLFSFLLSVILVSSLFFSFNLCQKKMHVIVVVVIVV